MSPMRRQQTRTVAHAASLYAFRRVRASCRRVVQNGERGMSVPRVFRDILRGIHIPRSPNGNTTSCRAGFTLLEVILALTIFFGALTVLSQLAWNGSRAAVQARLKTQAIVRCEAKLAEVLAGAEALQPKTRVPFPDNAQWTYSVSIAESQFPDLLQLQVTVAHTGNSSLASAEFSLWRWMRDPSLFLEAAELQQTEAEKESQSQGATQ